ncbi:MAG: C10 family peptidase [Muribaculaceae bacterium]|nr:C10 family peptidase [Muribaculaceae bacterium]
MKKLLSVLTVVMFALQLMAAPVDVSTAKSKAEQYLANKVYTGKIMAPGATEAKLIKTEMGDKAAAPVYYIFNTATTFVIVSGDDRAEEILAYGDKPLLLERIPKNMEAWLNTYKEQLDWLLTHPEAKVSKPTTFRSGGLVNTVIGPLLTALWDQLAPYNDLCHFTYSGTNYTCYTGCPATSASMVLYYWKYPVEPVGPLQGFTGTLSLGYWNDVSFNYPTLPQVTFDWDNMKDKYGTWYDENGATQNEPYTAEEGAAVATLMRYVGHAEHMMYGTASAGGSGIYTSDAQNVADMFIEFGYDESTTQLVLKSSYSETAWAQMLQEEMAEGRPVVYMAVDPGAGGHAFNVDGYNSNTNKYHINFGWSGDGNNWCVMNAFSDGGGYTFNSDQQMVIGIQPPMGMIKANPSEVNFDGFAGETYTQIVKVQARNLENDINITLTGDNVYSISHTSLTAAEAAAGVNVEVTYAPTEAGNTSASITLSCADEEVEDVVVPITGVAAPRVPTLLVTAENLDFSATLDRTVTKTIELTGAFLTNDVTVTLNDTHGVFTVTPTAIPQTSTDVNTPVTVAVSFSSSVEGTFNGSITFASEGAESKTVNLTGIARDGGTAIDPFLNIANYETIDEAGANVTGMNTIYKYTEYEEQDCAWLTLSNYGAAKADANQNWFASNSLTEYSNSWDANDIFPGQNAYFGSNQAYSVYGSNYQSFYVTNCTQVKAYVKGGGYSSSSATLAIYKCTLNANGSVTPATTAVDTQSGSNGVITSANLDEGEIYMVKLTGGGSYPDLLEIGFRTPLTTYETPVATDATEITANSFVANWNLCEGADSYILRVAPKNYDILTETFAKCTKAGAQDIGNNLDNFMDNTGWTGYRVYEAIGGMRLGTASTTGTLTSPGLNLLTSEGKVTVKFKAKAFNNDTDCELKVSCGNSSQTVTLADNNEANFTVVLDCDIAADQTITFENVVKGKRVVITRIHVQDGDHSNTTLNAIDEDGATFTGITTNSFKVLDLLPSTAYIYDVKAVFGAKQTKWSNQIMVTTLGGGAGVYGDVDGDGVVTTTDITCVYNYLLNGDETYLSTCDVDGDGVVTTTDITCIYNILLGAKK